MDQQPNVRLAIANRSENVILVRQMLAGLAEMVRLDELALTDITTATTEACNNVVVHAYQGREGPLEVDLYASQAGISVTVRDQGTGMRPKIRTAEEDALGIGMNVMQSLARSVQVTGALGEGTEVSMEFDTPGRRPLSANHRAPLDWPGLAGTVFAGSEIALALAPPDVARHVLPRMLHTLAAQARFSTDRISDAHMLADCIAAHAPEAIDGSHLGIGVDVSPRNLQLRVGPLLAGRGPGLLDDTQVDGLGSVIERLTDDRGLCAAGSSELLTLSLSDSR